MLPHQQRVVHEKNELDEKLAKLESFTHKDLFTKLTKEEQNRLEHQLFHMGAYSDILTARIAAF